MSPIFDSTTPRAKPPRGAQRVTVYLARDDRDLVVIADVYPGDPGRSYGEPGDCYPPSPAEVDIVSARCAGVAVVLTKDEIAEVRETAIEEVAEASEAAREEAAEWAAEMRRDRSAS